MAWLVVTSQAAMLHSPREAYMAYKIVPAGNRFAAQFARPKSESVRSVSEINRPLVVMSEIETHGIPPP